MKKIAVFISDGSEEIEALTPVDVLRRAGVLCDVVSVCNLCVTGSHDIVIKADKTVGETDFSGYDGLVIPGGMPGAKIISENDLAVAAVKKALADGRLVAAICASPAVVLAKHNLIGGKKATCYPAEAFIKAMGSSVYTGKDVEKDGNLITANGPRAAMAFALTICEYLGVTPAI